MRLNRRPKIRKLARKEDSKRLVAALGYHDHVTDRFDRIYDLGTSIRRDAALALASTPGGDDDVGAALIGALGDSSGVVRSAAATALAARRDKRALTALATAALTWREPRYEAARAAATEALLELNGPEAADAFVASVVRNEADPAEAAEILARMVELGGEETFRRASATAVEALSTADGAVPDRAADVLVWLGPGSVEALLSALTSEHTRLPAIVASGKLRDLRCSEALVGLLTDQDPQVRRAAATALGEIADPRVAPALFEATADTDPAVRESALAAVRKLGPASILQVSHSEEVTPVPVSSATTEAGKALFRRRSRSSL